MTVTDEQQKIAEEAKGAAVKQIRDLLLGSNQNPLSKMFPDIQKIVEENAKKKAKILEPFKLTAEDAIQEEVDRCKNRSFSSIIKDHKSLISSEGLVTGFDFLDNCLVFQKTDFVVIQGMSNHGKSSFMLNLAYHFLTNQENQLKSPLCIYLAYESHTLRTEEKFLNIISSALDQRILIKLDRATNIDLLDNKSRYGNYLYLDEESSAKYQELYEKLIKDNCLFIIKKQPTENLPKLIDYFKKKHENRTIVLFLDYIQILPQIPSSKSGDGWERMKELSYWLEALAIEKEIVLFTGSQVNENRDTREGRDIYNASTINLDIFNNSHDLLKDNEKLKNYYKQRIDGKCVISLSCRKAKFGETFSFPESFLFNGFLFEENKNKSVTLPIESKKKTTNKPNHTHGYKKDGE